MLRLIIIKCLILSVASQSLEDILLGADEVINKLERKTEFNVEEIDLLLRRTYSLYPENHVLRKRSLDDKSTLIRDKEGVHIFKNVRDAGIIPSRFPNDIALVNPNGQLFAVALEQKEGNPANSSDQLVIYKYIRGERFKTIRRVSVTGASTLSVQNVGDSIFIAAAEYYTERNVQSFQGTKVYKMISLDDYEVFFEKVQIIDVMYQQDLQFWKYLDQLYLIIAADNPSNNSSDILIFKWLGRHFDSIQKIPMDRVESITPFTIGSFMYLAAANHEDAQGNTDIHSGIYKFHLQDNKFKLCQRIPTQGSKDVKYFKFRDPDTPAEEHFLIYANYFSKKDDGSRNYEIASIVYKYVNDIFVPFQSFTLYGVKEWVPVTGENNEFLLLALCEHEIVGFQYDGWRFVKVSNFSLPKRNSEREIESMKAYYYSGNFLITVADKNNDGSEPNILQVTFEKINDLENRYEGIESWCDNMHSELSKNDVHVAMAPLKKIGSFESDSLNFTVPVHFPDSLKVNVLETDEFGSAGSDLIDLVDELEDDVENLKSSLRDVKEAMKTVENGTNYKRIEGPVNMPYLEINCRGFESCSFDDLHVKKLNGEDWDTFSKSLVPLDEDIELDFMEFENVTVENFSASSLNGHPVETLIDVNSNHLLNTPLTVNGTVIIHGELILDGFLDGIKIDKENVLLKKFDQNFTSKFLFNSTVIKNLELYGKLNDHDLEDLLKAPEKVDLGDTFAELNVHRLYVDGLISGYNVSDLKNALRRAGDEKIEDDCFIDNLTADDVLIDSNLLSGINLSELIQTTKNENYTLKGDLIFKQDELIVDNLIVKQIDSIPVSEFLVKGRSVAERQTSLILENITPENLNVKDIRNVHGNVSLLDIFENGLRLNETVVDLEVEFLNLEVKDLITERINNRSVNSWVYNDSTEPVVFTGEKVFQNDVKILEKSHVYLVDGIDVEELEKDALKLSGNQNVTGNVTFDFVKCDNLISESIWFGDKNLLDVINSSNRFIVNGPATFDELEADALNVSGTIDDVSWNEFQNDSIFKHENPDTPIYGEKILNGRVYGRHLNLNGNLNGLTFEEFFANTSDGIVQYNIPDDVVLNGTLTVENLIFEDTLDSIKAEDFGKEWLLSEGDQNITGPMTFEKLKLNSGCSLKNKIVNKVNVTSLFQDSLKIDEDAEIKSMQMMSAIKTTNVDVQGTLNGAKFKDAVVLARSEKPQIVEGNWIFNHNLTINGSLVVEEFISGLNVSHLCSLKLDDKEEEINLITGGSVKFDTEPKILETVNEIHTTSLLDQIWLKNQETVLTGKAKFTNLQLRDKTELKGLLNNVNLTNLAKNYVNKKTTRIILANMEFKSILIKETVKMNNVTVGGKINGIDIKKFSETVLLRDTDQIITGKIRFNEINVEDLKLNDTINDLDLNKDVLRYDVEDAVVKGEKKMEKLKVQYMNMSPGKSLQGVVVSDWKKNAAMVDGNVTIEGDVTFSGIKAPKLRVNGKVNDVKFDTKHLLTTNGNQVITGKKYFDLDNYPNQTLTLKTLNVTGLINGIDLKNLVENQAYKNGDLTFTKRINFTDGMKADGLTVDGLFQGVNVTEIFEEMSNTMVSNDLGDKFDRLLNESRKIDSLMTDGPYFLDHFELVQTVKSNVVSLVPFSFDTDGKLLLCTFTNNSDMDTLKWDSFSKTFVPQDRDMRINMTFVSPEITANKFYLYIETTNKTLLMDSGKMIEIQANNTACIASFEIKQLNKSCLFVGRKRGNSKILCNSTLMADLQTYTELETDGTLGVSALNIDEDVFIAVIDKKKIHGKKTENILWIYKYNRKYHHFQKHQTLPEVNPISVSTVTHENTHYLASAGGHVPGSVQSSILTVFRFDPNKGRFARYHSILVDTPLDVQFAVLPSSELILYVLTGNPAKPLVVFSHQGIRGFVKEASGLSLYRGDKLYPVTDKQGEHFVIISGYEKGSRGQILKASFKGIKN